MKRVNMTKAPSISQLINMSENLGKKYQSFSCVEFSAFTDIDNPITKTVSFWISVRGIYGKFTNSWEDCQSKYFKLME